MVAQLLSERSFRGPGCTDACEVVRAIVPGRFGRSELLLHDPFAHEEYGRITSWNGSDPVVWTGALVIDLRARTAGVHGRELELSPFEWSVLEYLAVHAGRICSIAELMTVSRGPVWATEDHVCRAAMSRLRAKLGPCGDLVETVAGRGYRLRMVEPVEAAP